MSGTKTGGSKSSITNKERHGEDFYCLIGSKGGSRKVKTKGFGASNERAKTAGLKGGSRSFKGMKLIKKDGEIYTYRNSKTNELVTVNHGKPQKFLPRFKNFVLEIL